MSFDFMPGFGTNWETRFCVLSSGILYISEEKSGGQQFTLTAAQRLRAKLKRSNSSNGTTCVCKFFIETTLNQKLRLRVYSHEEAQYWSRHLLEHCGPHKIDHKAERQSLLLRNPVSNGARGSEQLTHLRTLMLAMRTLKDASVHEDDFVLLDSSSVSAPSDGTVKLQFPPVSDSTMEVKLEFPDLYKTELSSESGSFTNTIKRKSGICIPVLAVESEENFLNANVDLTQISDIESEAKTVKVSKPRSLSSAVEVQPSPTKEELDLQHEMKILESKENEDSVSKAKDQKIVLETVDGKLALGDHKTASSPIPKRFSGACGTMQFVRIPVAPPLAPFMHQNSAPPKPLYSLFSKPQREWANKALVEKKDALEQEEGRMILPESCKNNETNCKSQPPSIARKPSFLEEIRNVLKQRNIARHD